MTTHLVNKEHHRFIDGLSITDRLAYERRRWAGLPYEKKREIKLKRDYGITWADFIKMYVEQDGKCSICKTPFDINNENKNAACVDHCHNSTVVRSLLCNPCNRVLGLVKENKETLKQMIEYLECHVYT